MASIVFPQASSELTPVNLCQEINVGRLRLCARCCEHRVDLTAMMGLVVE